MRRVVMMSAHGEIVVVGGGIGGLSRGVEGAGVGTSC